MRKIDALVQDIPLDELLGLSGEQRADVVRPVIPDEPAERKARDIIKTLPRKEDSPKEEPEERAEIASSGKGKGWAAAIAAAAAIAVGIGWLIAANRSKEQAVTSPAADSSVAVIPEAAEPSVSNSNAKLAYEAAADFVAKAVKRGAYSEIPVGRCAVDIPEIDDQTELGTAIRESGIEEGIVLLVIDKDYNVVTAKWKNENESEMYPEGYDSFVFKIETDDYSIYDTTDISEADAQAYELCKALRAYYDHEISLNTSELPKHGEMWLNFDHPDAYSDIICRLQKYADKPFTGTAYVFSDLDGHFFVECQNGSTEPVGRYPLYEGEINDLGELPSAVAELKNELDDVLSVKADTQFSDVKLTEKRDSDEKTNTAAEEIEQWYREFCKSSPEPTASEATGMHFFPETAFSICICIDGESVFIRCSDVEGYNIYVNGYYYSVPDITPLLTAITDLKE